MVESRCGITCNSLNCNEVFNVDCAGCVNIDVPFWGECEVKTCCEGRGLENCGLCGEFPCETLKKFSYAEEHGDNGLRIEQCKAWCSDKETV